MKNLLNISLLISCCLFLQCKTETQKQTNVVVTANSNNKDVIVNNEENLKREQSEQAGLEIVDTVKKIAIDTLIKKEENITSKQNEVKIIDTVKSIDEGIKIIKPSPAPVYIEPKPKPKKYDGSIDSILFESIVFNFDTITEGEIIKHNFNFINTNSNPIEVKSTNPDCGCTTPSFPFLPLENNDKGFIGVTYNSVGKSGLQNATVHVKFLNVKDEVVLTMSGYVKDKQKEVQLDAENK